MNQTSIDNVGKIHIFFKNFYFEINKYEGYLRIRFHFFRLRFACRPVPTQVSLVPSRTQRAPSPTLIIFLLKTFLDLPIPPNTVENCQNLSISAYDSLLSWFQQN